MVVVGLALGWLREQRQISSPREQLKSAWWRYGPGDGFGAGPKVDWSVFGSEYKWP